MKPFHIIVFGIFVFLAVAGVIVFAKLGGVGGSADEVGTVVMWGVLPQSAMEKVLSEVRLTRNDFNAVSYVEKKPPTYTAELINAIAAGTGPDLALLSQDDIVRMGDKFLSIPYANLSERDFKDRFISEGELFLGAQGIIGLPFTIGPLVMYWNRQLFAQEGLAEPPKTWDEFFALSQKLTKKNQTGTITRSAVALGEYANIPHAKDLLAALILQAGNPIVVATGQDAPPQAVLARRDGGAPLSAGELALGFYTEFSNPAKSTYSWNRALPNARDMFSAGDLAVYFGYASELRVLRNANPNLDFDVALLPQAQGAKTKVTFGRLAALGIARGTGNAGGALAAALELSGVGALTTLAAQTALPPVRRDLLSQAPASSYQQISYTSALISRGWLDPDPALTEGYFRIAIENVTSGRLRLGEAVLSLSNDLQHAFTPR